MASHVRQRFLLAPNGAMSSMHARPKFIDNLSIETRSFVPHYKLNGGGKCKKSGGEIKYKVLCRVHVVHVFCKFNKRAAAARIGGGGGGGGTRRVLDRKKVGEESIFPYSLPTERIGGG